MPSNFTPELGIELQAAGENLSTWGDPKLNNALKRLTKAISGFLTIALSGDLTLSSSQSSTDPNDFQAFHNSLKFTGTGTFTVTVPSKAQSRIIWNACSGALTVTTGAGGTASISSGDIVAVLCDGSNCSVVKLTDFGGSALKNLADPSNPQDAATKAYVDAQAFSAAAGNLPGQPGNAGKFLKTDGLTASWGGIVVADVAGAAPAASPNFTGGITLSGGSLQDGSSKSTPATPAAANFDLSAADFFTKSISSSTTFTFSNTTASKAQAFVIELTISSSAVPTWPASVTWDGGVTPIFGNGVHLVGFISFNGGTSWRGMVGGRAFA